MKQQLNEYSLSRPGIKVLGLSSIKDMMSSNISSLSLMMCYNNALTDTWFRRSDGVPFTSFANFVVDFFMACSRGSTDEVINRVARGRLPKAPQNSDGTPPAPGNDDDDPANSLMARHSLKITMESNLPGIEGLIRRD
jgi:hypothetical protein